MNFQSAIIKVNSVCNMNCTYCYMFNGLDETFKHTKDHMSINVAVSIIDEVTKYCLQNKFVNFKLVIHGGEPTLWKIENYIQLFEYTAKNNAKYNVNISFSMQSNGLYISDDLIKLLFLHKIPLSISIDGPKDINDTCRVDKGGKGTYERIIANVNKISNSEYSTILSGFLSVINLNISPIDYLQWVKSLPIQKIDVLWPIGLNYDTVQNDFILRMNLKHNLYGKWMKLLFLEWLKDAQPNIHIRLFFESIGLYMGSKSHNDSLGNDVLNMFVINTEGQIEYPDYFRWKSESSCFTNINISDGIERLHQDSFFQDLLELKKFLPNECLSCPHKDVCGGGFIAGRIKNNKIVLNEKSILCENQKVLFNQIEHSLHQYT